MRKKLNKFKKKYGQRELLFLFFYPVFLPIIMIKDTIFSFFNIIKALLKYDWKNLAGNDQRNAYNNFFYYVQDYNIQKFGRYGQSNLLAGGDFSLKNWFHTTPFSLRLQASFGTTFIMFFATFFWLFSWIILYQDNPNLWILLVVFFSTLFFATFVEIQNYNILGWMLYPILLTYLESGNYLVLSIVLFFVALSSFTAFFIAGILVVVSSIYLSDYYILLCIVAGGIKWIIPILVSMKDGALSKMLGAIGGHNAVKYSRKNTKKFSISKIYILSLQMQFALVVMFFNIDIQTVLLFVIVSLFIVNERIVRFADQQSFYFLYLSLSIFCILNMDMNIYILISFILSIYPAYKFIMNVLPKGDRFIAPGERKPYNMSYEINGLNNFFKPVPREERILIVYKNPEGNYNNIFEGFRVYNEIIQYAAMKKNICIFPDWYMVFENNKSNSDESFWMNSKDEIAQYLKLNKINYFISKSELTSGQFKKVSKFSFFGDYEGEHTEELKIFLYKIGVI